jgi:twinkle protein
MPIEKAIEAFDRITSRGRRVPDVDFLEYLKTRDHDNDNVKRPHDFAEEVLAAIDGTVAHGSTLPWVKTHDQVRFRMGEVSMWAGFNGHKKSLLLGYVSLGFMKQGEPVCIASFEMKPASTVNRMLKQAAGTTNPTRLSFDRFLDMTDGKLWLYDQQGIVTPERLYGVIYYAADKLGVKHFIIDSLMRVVAGEDDYNAQKDFVTRLCAMAQELDIHIHFVHHNKKGDESKPAGRYDAKGSGALSDNVHNAFNVWSKKDKEQEDSFPDVILRCDKQREGDWEGAIGLWFVESSLQFSGTPSKESRTWF